MKKFFFLLLISYLSITTIAAENKTALVIGNGAYSHFSELSNPKSEAIEMKNALQRLGFDVILLLDGTEDQILDSLSEFETKLEQRGGLALFHYGGHGVQVNGSNYIIPVEADIPDERRVKSRAVDIDEVLGVMDVSGSQTNIVILDACRNNPLPGASRNASRGLAVVIDPPSDSIIVYSADAGTTAQDGLFTPALLKYLETPGLELGSLLRKVRTDVRTASGGNQRTGEYNQLESEVYLAGNGSDSGNRTPGFVVDESIYGSVKVSVEEGGTLFLNGIRMGDISSSRSATLSDIETGSHFIEIRYSDKTESRNINVSENNTLQVHFSYRSSEGGPLNTEGMIPVTGGTFSMGSSRGNDDEIPVHTVTVSSFHMGLYEVTQGEWESVMGATVVHQRDKVNPDWNLEAVGSNYPMYYINWFEAVEYCNRISLIAGLTPVYSGRGENIQMNMEVNGYRLATEAEWEFAARGGNASLGYDYSGSNNLDSAAWYSGNSGADVHPVGEKQANELGLYDMSGNVWEWCWDWYGNYTSEYQINPFGFSSGSNRVDRGGSWGDGGSQSTFRGNLNPYFRYTDVGFRVVRRP